MAHIQPVAFQSLFHPALIVDSKVHSAMPRQSPQRPKPSNHEMRVLINQYKIHFKGLLSPSQWPDGHPDIFTKIRQIRLIEFDTYRPDENTDNCRLVDKLKNCAFKLVSVANEDRKEDTKEFALRMSTEPLVFKRFKEEMKWSANPLNDVIAPRANLSLSANAAANFSGYRNFRHYPAIPLKRIGCRGDVPRGRSVTVLQNLGFGRMGTRPTVWCVVPSTS